MPIEVIVEKHPSGKYAGISIKTTDSSLESATQLDLLYQAIMSNSYRESKFIDSKEVKVMFDLEEEWKNPEDSTNGKRKV